MPGCNKHHITFEKLDNNSHKAVDVFCGIPYNGMVWYCSEECKKGHIPKLKYKMDDEEIMND